MLDQTLRRRLSQIARGKSVQPPPASSHAQDVPQTGEPNAFEFRGVPAANEFGEFLVRDIGLNEFHPQGANLASRFQALEAALECDPGDALLLDLETTGLCGVPLFLAGLMRFGGDGFRITQLFARNYAEEKSVLREAARVTAESRLVVTFNGNSFDLPYLRDRSAFHLLPFELTQRSLDILPHARRRWKPETPDCRLQTLEWFVCGRRRVGDIPGHLIPEVYHQYVQSGDMTPLLPVFQHNALDLVTTLEILLTLFEE